MSELPTIITPQAATEEETLSNTHSRTRMDEHQQQDSNVTDDQTNDNNIHNNNNNNNHNDRVPITTKSASATAAADSDRTNSSSITSSSSTGGMKHNTAGSEDADTKNVSTSHVSFGSVHVHEHRMTLGTNPDVSYGVPVELAWSADTSDMFDSIEEFERKAHQLPENQSNKNTATTNDGTTTTTTIATTVAPPVPYTHTVRRLKASDRDEIASQHHSRDSIVRVKQEVQKIQEQRHDSKKDKEPMKIIKEIRRQRMQGTLTAAPLDGDGDGAKNMSMDRANVPATDVKQHRHRSVWFTCCPF
jgi:hypothetical protein